MHKIKWFDALEFLNIITNSQIESEVKMSQMKKGTFMRSLIIDKWQQNKSGEKRQFKAFCLGKGWKGFPTRCNISEKLPGVAGGIMPCCIEKETGRPLVLLGLEEKGWCNFQGRVDSTDTSLGHTFAREGAEELVYCLGSAEEI